MQSCAFRNRVVQTWDAGSVFRLVGSGKQFLMTFSRNVRIKVTPLLVPTSMP
jgi:hypothetical protein